MSKRVVLAALLSWAFMVVATAGVARADNWGLPMSFKLKPNGSIVADGDIMKDTPERLESFLQQNNIPPDADLELNSRGGILLAGIRMGEIIRAHRLHTWVAADTKIAGLYQPPPGCSNSVLGKLSLGCIDLGTYPGYCISACTFAFLGGVDRRIWDGSIYAVHQAAMECRGPNGAHPGDNADAANDPSCPDARKAFETAQVMSGLLIAYARKMGVDPGFLSEMSSADPSHVNPLSEAQMKSYRILYQPGGVQWSLESSPTGEFFLQETTTTEWKTNYVRFLCRRNPDARLVIEVVYDPAAARTEDVSKLVASGQLGLKLSYSSPDWMRQPHRLFDLGPEIVLNPDEILRYPFRTADGKIELVLLASSRIMQALRTSTWFMISNAVLGKDFAVFGSADPIDRTRFDEFAASCH